MAVDVIPTRPRSARSETRLRAVGLRLLGAVPPMREAVPPEDRELADRVLFAPTDSFEPGPVVLPERQGPQHPFTVIIVDATNQAATSRLETDEELSSDDEDELGDDDWFEIRRARHEGDFRRRHRRGDDDDAVQAPADETAGPTPADAQPTA